MTAKAKKMASISFDLMTTKLFDIKEIFARLDPVQFSHVMEDAILIMMDQIIHEAVSYTHLTLPTICSV